MQAKLKQPQFYYFSVAMDSMTKFKQARGKRKETLKFWNAAISKYIRLVFLYVL